MVAILHVGHAVVVAVTVVVLVLLVVVAERNVLEERKGRRWRRRY